MGGFFSILGFIVLFICGGLKTVEILLGHSDADHYVKDQFLDEESTIDLLALNWMFAIKKPDPIIAKVIAF